MKKLKLKALELGASEVLTRDQLQKVMGGDDGDGSGSSSSCTTKCSYDKWNPTLLRYEKQSNVACDYVRVGTIGGCFCPGTTNATTCS